jgi:hypothetical protein
MKATLLLAGLVALSALANAQARLGWTLSECSQIWTLHHSN